MLQNGFIFVKFYDNIDNILPNPTKHEQYRRIQSEKRVGDMPTLLGNIMILWGIDILMESKLGNRLKSNLFSLVA